MEQRGKFQDPKSRDGNIVDEKRRQWEQAGVFGCQNGVAEKDSAKYVAAVWKTFKKEMEHSCLEAEFLLYQSAITHLPDYQIDSDVPQLKFKEDREVHLLIQEMAESDRIAFTLFYFHQKSIEDIAKIVNGDMKLLRISISESLAKFMEKLEVENEDKAVKRLELANKSYLRIPFCAIEEKGEEPLVLEERVLFPFQPEKKALPDKKTKVFLLSAGFLLAGVIGSTFFMDDPNSDAVLPLAEAEENNIVTAAMVKEWQEAYEEVRNASPGQLGIEPEDFNKLEYVKKADQLKNWVFSERNIKELKNEPEEMQRQVDLLMLKIETPQEMLAMMQELYLIGDELEQAIDDYAGKTKELIVQGSHVLKEHETELADVNVDGAIYMENLLMQHNSASEEVKELMDSLQERGLTVIQHPADNRFILRRNMEILYGIDQLNSNYSVHLFRFDPFFDEEGLLVSVEEMASALPMVESILIEEEVASKKFEEYAHVFQHAFWLFLKGDMNQQVFDEHGVVKEKYQRTWKELGQQTHHPLLFVMLPILKEMEASGWAKSESYNRLSYSDIMDALLLEKEGKLAGKLPNSDVTIESEQVSAEDFYTPAIEKLYLSFAEAYDQDRLRDATPLDIFRLFQYANQQENPVMMWHLMSEDKPSLEEYKAIWRQQPSFAEQIRYMEIPKEAMHRIGESLYIYPNISYLEEEGIMYHPELITAKDHIWEIRSHLYEMYDMSGNGEAFKKKVENLYTAFSANLAETEISTASPGEIGGLFLLAAEKKDNAMVKALISGEQEQSAGILEAQLESRGVPAFSDTETIKFFDDSIHNFAADFSSGSLWFKEAGREESEALFNSLQMVKTPSGWRMGDLNIY